MKIRFNPTVTAVLAVIESRIEEQEHIIAEETKTSDEQSPLLIHNATRYIADLNDKRQLLKSHNRDDVLMEIYL